MTHESARCPAHPAPGSREHDCPPPFGNSDIFGAAVADPTP